MKSTKSNFSGDDLLNMMKAIRMAKVIASGLQKRTFINLSICFSPKGELVLAHGSLKGPTNGMGVVDFEVFSVQDMGHFVQRLHEFMESQTKQHEPLPNPDPGLEPGPA